jgi:hypothetical protein
MLSPGAVARNGGARAIYQRAAIEGLDGHAVAAIVAFADIERRRMQCLP